MLDRRRIRHLSERTEGREGRVVEAPTHDAVLELLAGHHRLER